MNDRIKKLAEKTLNGEMFPKTIPTEFDVMDILLSRQERESKRLCEYILNQEPVLTEFSKMTGFFAFGFNSGVVGDAFNRLGHKATREILSSLYCKPIDNLSTFEWQHAVANFEKVLEKGIAGIIEEINNSLKKQDIEGKIEFLNEYILRMDL